MKSFIVGLCGAAIFTASAANAQSTTTTTTTTSDDETRVAITGCVEKAKQSGRYVFTHVTDAVEGGRNTPPVIYWVTSTKGLKEHVGHTVEVSGTVRPDKDQGRMGRLEAEVDGITGESKLAVYDGDKKAEVENVPDLPVGTSGTVTKVEISRPVLRLKPAAVKLLDPSCREAMRIAGTLRRPDTTLALQAAPAAAPVTIEPAVPEVAAVQPPPATAPVPEPVPVPEPAPVGTSGTTTTRPTPEPAPAPVTAAPEPAPAPAAPAATTERSELPKTASPLPFYLAIAFGAVAAAGAIRLLRKA